MPELETIQRVFGMLADRYHPNNPKTGDLDLFVGLKQAYDVLLNRRRAGAIYPALLDGSFRG